MKFKFNLEKLLIHREKIKDEAMSVFAIAQQELSDAVTELNNLYKMEEDSFKENNDIKRNGGKAVANLLMTDNFLKGLKIKVERQKEIIRAKQSVVEDRQNELMIAAQDFKSLEKLKDRKQEKFKKKMKLKELKEVDDNTIMRFGRGNI